MRLFRIEIIRKQRGPTHAGSRSPAQRNKKRRFSAALSTCIVRTGRTLRVVRDIDPNVTSLVKKLTTQHEAPRTVAWCRIGPNRSRERGDGLLCHSRFESCRQHSTFGAQSDQASQRQAGSLKLESRTWKPWALSGHVRAQRNSKYPCASGMRIGPIVARPKKRPLRH